MMDDTVTPDTKLTGAALAAPGAPATDGLHPDFAKALAPAGDAPATFDDPRVPELEAKLADTQQALDVANDLRASEKAAWEKERDSLLTDTANALAARDAAEAKTAKKGGVTKTDAPARPRKIGPMSGDTDAAAALAKAVAAGATVEIAFSDGKQEIAGLDPVAVTGDVWRDHRLGTMLRDPVKVTGPSEGGASVSIDGYALLIDGKQAGYCKRSDPLMVAPGQTLNIADDIYF